MTEETCDVLDLLEDLGLQIAWNERFEALLRRTVYVLHAFDDEQTQWIVIGDHEPDVLDALLEQLDWRMFDGYVQRLPAASR